MDEPTATRVPPEKTGELHVTLVIKTTQHPQLVLNDLVRAVERGDRVVEAASVRPGAAPLANYRKPRVGA